MQEPLQPAETGGGTGGTGTAKGIGYSALQDAFQQLTRLDHELQETDEEVARLNALEQELVNAPDQLANLSLDADLIQFWQAAASYSKGYENLLFEVKGRLGQDSGKKD